MEVRLTFFGTYQKNVIQTTILWLVDICFIIPLDI